MASYQGPNAPTDNDSVLVSEVKKHDKARLVKDHLEGIVENVFLTTRTWQTFVFETAHLVGRSTQIGRPFLDRI